MTDVELSRRMDSFSALALAGNVVQFVDSGSKIFLKSREICLSADGASSTNRNLEQTVRYITRLCDSLIQPEKSLDPLQASKEELALSPLARSCKELGDKLLSVLLKLRKGEHHRRWQSVYQALRSVWKEKEIQAYQDQLVQYRS